VYQISRQSDNITTFTPLRKEEKKEKKKKNEETKPIFAWCDLVET